MAKAIYQADSISHAKGMARQQIKLSLLLAPCPCTSYPWSAMKAISQALPIGHGWPTPATLARRIKHEVKQPSSGRTLRDVSVSTSDVFRYATRGITPYKPDGECVIGRLNTRLAFGERGEDTPSSSGANLTAGQRYDQHYQLRSKNKPVQNDRLQRSRALLGERECTIALFLHRVRFNN